MLGKKESTVLLSMGCLAAAVHADPVDVVSVMTSGGQAVPAPYALYLSLADTGSVISSDTTGQILFAGEDDTNAALYLMLAGPSNQAPGDYLPLDVTPLGGSGDSPADPGAGSIFQTLRPDGSQTPGDGAPPQFSKADATASVVVPMPSAGALAAAGLALVIVRPRRKR